MISKYFCSFGIQYAREVRSKISEIANFILCGVCNAKTIPLWLKAKACVCMLDHVGVYKYFLGKKALF